MSELKRRDFLKILGLSGAGTGLVGCAQEPAQKLIPYLVPGEEIIPGLPNWYASTCRECPAGCGLHVKVREGRPIKVEGNPDHPVNSGRLCARGQASLQGLYNPDRITSPLLRNEAGNFQPISWDEAETMLADRIGALQTVGRADALYLITDGAIGSLDDLFDEWMRAIGSPNRVIHESFDVEPLREANRLTFGIAEIPRYDIDGAELLLSFGAGFLETWITPVQYTRLFAQAHSFRDGHKARFIHFGPRLSLTGSNADEWLRTQPESTMWLALAMTHVLVNEGVGGQRGDAVRSLVTRFTPERAADRTGIDAETIVRIAHELAEAPASLALPPGVEMTHRNATADHVAVNLLNYVAGNVGRTVRFGPNVMRRQAAGISGLRGMVDAMRGGRVEIAFVHGTDPVFTLPGELGFGEALDDVGMVVSFASFMDETAARAHLILPDHTPLESWGDHVPEAGVRSLMQPTVSPIFDSKHTGDVLLSVASRLGRPVTGRFEQADYRDYLRNAWRRVHREFSPREDFEEFWHAALSRGGVWRQVGTQTVTLNRAVTTVSFSEPELDGEGADSFKLLVYPSPYFYDGRGANRPWLQELPDPVTKVVWNSWIEIHPDVAGELGVGNGDVLAVTSPHGRLEAPAYVYRGIRRDAVAIPIGQGHEHFGRYARDRGVNPLGLLPAARDDASGSPAWLSTQVTLTATGRRALLVDVQGSDTDHDREISEVIGFDLAVEEEEHAHQEVQFDPDALVKAAADADPKSPYRWGMAIDLSSCIGCSACVTACYAENNIPVVEEERCAEGREMAWIRVSRFYKHVAEENAHGGRGRGRRGRGR